MSKEKHDDSYFKEKNSYCTHISFVLPLNGLQCSVRFLLTQTRYAMYEYTGICLIFKKCLQDTWWMKVPITG